MKPPPFLLPALLLFASLASAQLPKPLRLEDCLSQALEQNPEIKNAQLGLLLPDAQRGEVRANLLPQINASGNYQYYLEVPRQMIPASAFGGPEGEYAAAQFGVPLNMNTTLQATQVLYSQPLRLALRQVEVGRELAQLNLQSTREEIAYNVSAAYFNAQALAKQIVFLEGNLSSLERVTKTTQLLAGQQLATAVDVQRLQLQQQNLQNQLQNLRDQQLRVHRLLQLLMGIPQTEDIAIDTTIRVLDVTTLASPPLVAHTALKLIEKQKGNLLLEQQSIRAGALPTIAAFGSYSMSGFGKFGDNNLLKFYPSSAVGVTAQWNIFDGQARKAKITQKNLKFQQLEHQQAYLQESIAMQTANARTQILSNQRALEAAASSVRLADKVLQQTTLQLQEGLATITDLLNAENSLREAQTNYLSTLINLRTAQLEMEKASGHLLD